jgi:hypothetical protein
MAKKYKEMASVGMSKASTQAQSASGVKSTVKKIDYRNKVISSELEDVAWLSHLKNKKKKLKQEKFESLVSDPMFSALSVLAPDSYDAYSKGAMFEYGEGNNKSFLGIDDISNLIAVGKYFKSGDSDSIGMINEIIGNSLKEPKDE